ncbi:MAG: pyruvate kinase [Rhodospirillales bacterium]|nr:pyruvate kinase [Rhodospirillales bacterium]
MRRQRKAKIVATLGPSSSSLTRIRSLFQTGADVFRLNFSHGEQSEQLARMQLIRQLEEEFGRPIGVLADMQGPKLRLGRFAAGKIALKRGQSFRLDRSEEPGDSKRVCLPHPEIFEALDKSQILLLDDGKVSLQVVGHGADWADCRLLSGAVLSDRKGVNLPGVMLPISPLTAKDRSDLSFALDMGVDWIALSFVQRPEDLAEARKLIQGRAQILSKIEKPSALEQLHEIVELSDAVMVARGDLGVEMPLQHLPRWQKKIVRKCRSLGKPVIVATQMLESMVSAPSPTRAEVSDVATAVYDGADAVMLSAESASGRYPAQAVSTMSKVIAATERDRFFEPIVHALKIEPESTGPDAIAAAAAQVAETTGAGAIVCYTSSGATAKRVARERPNVPILVLTEKLETARSLALLWGAHCVQTPDIASFPEMVEKAGRIALEQGFASKGSRLVVTAGLPFGTPGATNVLRIARIG